MSGKVEQRRIPPVDAMGDEVRVEPQQPELSTLDRGLLTAALAGPIAWCLQLGFDLPLVGWMCHHGVRWPSHVVSLVAALLTLWGLVICWRDRGGPHGGEPGRRGRESAPSKVRSSLAIFGIGTGIFFLLLILASDVPGLILEPCR